MKLTILSGENTSKSIPLSKNKSIIIGRDTSCDFPLKDIRSSRHHAKVYYENSKFYIEDLNSTNGTILNGELIFKHPLKNNDKILIGDTAILFGDSSLEKMLTSSSVHFFEDSSPTVIVTAMPKNEADLIDAKLSFENAEDLVLENKILRKICEISQIIAKQKDINSLLVEILDQMQEVLQSDTACILILSESETDWEIRAKASGMPDTDSITISRTILHEALQKGMTILTKYPLSDTNLDPSSSIVIEGITSAICAPIKINDRFQGLLLFDRRKRLNVFTSMDLRLASTVANILELLLEKEKLEIESKRKERLVVIGEVIAGLAHYTKNIITGLRFSINALEVIIKKKQYDSIERCLKSISSQERRISELVLNMLSYSKERKPAKNLLDLKELMEDLFDPYLGHLKENNIIYTLDFLESTPKIYAEEPAMHRVFLNLLLNAIDSFKQKPISSKREIKVIIKPLDADNVQILFRDTGKGIAKEHYNKVFNIFFSTKGSEGTGIGLAVVKKIITEHSGRISVSSEIDKWTEFSIVLPIK